jgi:hypothetical protein
VGLGQRGGGCEGRGGGRLFAVLSLRTRRFAADDSFAQTRGFLVLDYHPPRAVSHYADSMLGNIVECGANGR